MPEPFTDEEKSYLKPFVTNLDKDVFVLQNLPEVIKGALFSRYSRSRKSLRRLLLDEFIKDKETGFQGLASPKDALDLSQAVSKAQAFYDRILDGYGDDSVGELGGAHIACEMVSNIAAKALEDARIGGSPLEKSTRYVWFDEKVDGKYLYYREPKIMQSKFADEYIKVCDHIFDTYVDLSKKMLDFVTEKWPIEDFEFFDMQTKKEIPYSELTDEKKIKRAGIAYRSAVRARACDALRGLLPASTLTNVGIFGNGRFFQSLISRLYSSPLSELNHLGTSMHTELNTLIPSFIRRARTNEYNVKIDEDMSKNLLSLTKNAAEKVTLISYDQTEYELLAKMLYPFVDAPLQQLIEKVKAMNPQEREAIVEKYVGTRSHRRDKPGRALEQIYYSFDILADFGNYRDLQRHRILTQERQLLSTGNGYEVPEEIIVAGFKEKFDGCMKRAADLYEKMQPVLPLEAQYVVPFAYNVRWYMKLNLREAMHFIELRSTPQGHPGYRKIAQEMFKKIEQVHPTLAKHFKFVDMNDYPLGRISSESKKEETRAARSA